MKWPASPLLVLAILALCLLECSLYKQSSGLREFETAVIRTRWIMVAFSLVCCGSFLLLAVGRGDLPLVVLLLIAIAALADADWSAMDAIILLFCVGLGKAAFFTFHCFHRRWAFVTRWPEMHHNQFKSASTLLMGLVGVLAFSSWWGLDMSNNPYRGPRWMGLWTDPNVFGILMGTGSVLAVGLLLQKKKVEIESGKLLKLEHGCSRQALTFNVGRFESRRDQHKQGQLNRNHQPHRKSWLREFSFLATLKPDSLSNLLQAAFLLCAIFIMGVGLVCSFSRGAWLGTGIGLGCLAWWHGRFRWSYVLAIGFLLASIAILCWGRTPNSAPWYLKRLDFSRPSTQHRVAAWLGAFHIICDHPFGVGWKNTVIVYCRDYSPPDGGAMAIMTNDYLLLGTQLGLPGLVCFVMYVGLCLRGPNRRDGELGNEVKDGSLTAKDGSEAAMSIAACYFPLRLACKAGAITMLVAFWFDDGLFSMPTASVFWVLLELGRET